MFQILAAALTVTLFSCEDACEPGETDLCHCSNGQIGAQVCKNSGDGWGACDCTGNTGPDGDTDTDSDTEDPSCTAINRATCYALYVDCNNWPFTPIECEMEWCECMEDIGCNPLDHLPELEPWEEQWFDCEPGAGDSDTDTDAD
jgi:hypothetical protein